MMMQRTLTDFDIQALVDNELSWEEEKALMAYIEATPKMRQRYEELARQKRLLQAWWVKGGFSH